jgi:YesN/AraC family two-component response regulator
MIHNGYHTEIHIPALAKAENLSNSRYVELFRQKTGLSPTAYLIRLRIQVACDLLESTDIPVAQISRMVSYNDSHFFSKLFKKHVGMSPTQYRNQKREGSFHE